MIDMNFTASRTVSALALAAAIVGAPLAATASPGESAGGGWAHRPQAHQHMGMQDSWGGPMMRGSMLRGLDLTQDQQDQIFKIRHDQAQAIYDQHKAVREAARTLRELGQADAFDQAKAGQAADALGQAQGRLALLQAESMARIRAVLTPEQRQKLAERHAGQRRGHHPSNT
jgi:Spy/CpxP family protein refolding chaperone